LLESLKRHLDRRQWLQAKQAAEALLLLPPGELTTLDLGQVYYGYGRASAWLQEHYAAIRLFELATRHALQARDWDTLGFSRAEAGIVSVFIGDLVTANEMFAAYYLDLSRYKDAKACEALVRYNNGLALRRQHRHGEAVVAYHMALNLFVERGRTADAAECHQNLAWLHLLDNKAVEALPHLECAQSHVDTLGQDYRIEMLVCWGLYHFVLREVGTSMEYLAEILSASPSGSTQAGISARHKSEASWIAGEIAILLDQAAKALILARWAQQEAIVAREPELMNRATGLLARSRATLLGGDSEAAQ